MAVTRHDRSRAAFFDCDLKRFEIQFAHRLFVCPNGKTQTVAFLVIQGKMLGVQIDALRLGTAHLRCAKFAGEESVFGIILKVTSAERRSVDIHAWRIQTDNAVGGSFHSKYFAEFFNQFFIPGRADHDFARERDAAKAADQRVDTRRTVQIGGRRFADTRNSRRRPAAVQDHGSHVIVRELLQKKFPFRVIPVETRHVFENESVVRIYDRGIGCVDFIWGFFGESLYDCVRCRFAVHALFRRCAGPVGAGNVNRDLSVLDIGKMRDRSSFIR